MSDPVNLRPSGPPETVLEPEDPDVLARLAAAAELPAGTRRDAVAAVVADHPKSLHAWAALGACARDDIETYAAYRVGYHRGLDRLRASGWRGSGYVRWRHQENVGFLRSLAGLAEVASRIGESDEAERCRHFLAQLDPSSGGSEP